MPRSPRSSRASARSRPRFAAAPPVAGAASRSPAIPSRAGRASSSPSCGSASRSRSSSRRIGGPTARSASACSPSRARSRSSLYREVVGDDGRRNGSVHVDDGVWSARDAGGLKRRFAWTDRVRRRELAIFDTETSAKYGATRAARAPPGRARRRRDAHSRRRRDAPLPARRHGAPQRTRAVRRPPRERRARGGGTLT